MKQLSVRFFHVWRICLLFCFTFGSAFSAMAQDGGLDIDVDINRKEWYEEPWAWVVGAAVFILLLVAILRGGRKGR